MILDRHVNLKYRYGRRKFWAIECFVDYSKTKWKEDKRIYKNQLEEDDVAEQIS